MFDNMTSIHSDALDDILKSRRSVRVFGKLKPDKNDINQIIQAGLIAPFALDACVIGYPTDSYKLPNVNYPEFHSNVTWL